MPSWFKWGRSIQVAVSRQPVRRVCGCGQAVDVLRTDQFQRLACASCGQIGILLPQDGYPGSGPADHPSESAADPVVTTTRSRPAERSGRAKPVGDSPGRARPVSGSTSARPSSESKPQPTPPPVSEPPPPEAAEPSAGRQLEEPLVTRRGIQAEPAHTPRRRRVTPFRLVALCMVMLVGVTGWWSLGQLQLSSDASRLRDLMRTGLESLEAGDFSTAARDLVEATDVLDRLGRKDSAADLIRQRGREAAAANGLVSVSLVDILSDADRLQRSGVDGAWRRQFQRDHRGRWIIMQSVLEQPGERLDDEARASGQNRLPDAFEAEYPFAVGERAVRLSGRLPALVRLSGWDDPGDEDPRPVIFAGQLEACRFDPGTQTWWIELSADTAFLWTDIVSYGQLGFLPHAIFGDEEIAAVLKRQSAAAGIAVDGLANPGQADDGSPETRSKIGALVRESSP